MPAAVPPPPSEPAPQKMLYTLKADAGQSYTSSPVPLTFMFQAKTNFDASSDYFQHKITYDMGKITLARRGAR